MTKQCLNCWSMHDSNIDICPNCGFEEKRAIYENALYRGAILQNRYRIEDIIHADRDFVTYLANDSRLQRKVEIKEYMPIDAVWRGQDRMSLIKKENCYSRIPFEEGVNNFWQESQMLMQHGNTSNVGYIYDIIVQNNTTYTVNEILNQGNLATYLSEKGMLSQNEVMDIMIPVIAELENLKSNGIVHYDLRMENIMIMTDEEANIKGKLVNFGVIRQLERIYQNAQPANTNGEMTIPYSEIYALGEILYQLVTGVEPASMEERIRRRRFFTDPLKFPHAFNDSVTDDFENAIMNALAFHEKDRTATFGQLEEELISFEPVKQAFSKGGIFNVFFWPTSVKVAVPVVSACAVAILLAIGSIHPNAVPAGMIQIPNYSGMSFETAQEKIQADKIPIIIREYDTQYSPDFEEGIILNQDPQGGRIEKKNSIVNVTLSTSVETYKMPNVTGKSEEDATNALTCMGVDVITVQVPAADGLAKGTVADQDTTPYENVSSGDLVTLKVTSDENSKSAAAPSVENKSYEEALQIAKDQGVVIRVKDVVFTDDYQENTIVKQHTAPGETVEEGDAIEVDISQKIRTFEMPNLKYKDYEDAEQLMKNIGVTVHPIPDSNEMIPKNKISSQEIEKGSEVTPGEAVTLNVSTGSKPFAMPNLVGKTEEEAKQELEDSGLAYQISYDFNEIFNVGLVMDQDVPEGQDITKGSEVNIIVCSDAETVRVPSVVGMTEAEARESIENNGGQVLVHEVPSNEMNNGKVVSQTPEVGTKMKQGDVVAVNIGKATVSKPATDTNPNTNPNTTPAHETDANINAVKYVTLNYDSLTFRVLGEQKLLRALFVPLNAEPTNYSWESSDPSVAAVDPVSGLVISKKNGETDIIYKCDGLSAICKVRVNATAGLTLNHDTLDFDQIGQIQYLECDTKALGYSYSTCRWYSSNTSVATVDENGFVQAVGDGECHVTCYVDGETISARIRVNTNTVKENTTVSTTIEKEETDTTTTFLDASLPEITETEDSVTTTTEDTAVPTVIPEEPETTTTEPEPVILPESIELKDHSWTFGDLNDSRTLEYEIYPADAIVSDDIYWESSDSNCVAVDQTGTIIAKAEGSAEITVHCGNLSDTCIVEVSLPVQLESVSMNQTSLEFQNVGDVQYLQFSTTPDNYIPKSKPEWYSTNESVATVEDGTVICRGSGECQIYVNCDGVEASCLVNVYIQETIPEYYDSTTELSDYLLAPLDYMSNQFGLSSYYGCSHFESDDSLDVSYIELPDKFLAEADGNGEICRINVFDREYSLYQLTVESSLEEIRQRVGQEGFNTSAEAVSCYSSDFSGYYYEYRNNDDRRRFMVFVDDYNQIQCMSLICDNSY